jgi:FkbM family methyltransferase
MKHKFFHRFLWRQGLRPLLIYLAGERLYTVRQGLTKGLKRKGGTGFIPRPLSLEERFLKTLDFSGQTIYDVGAHEGMFSMFFSRAVGENGKVIIFEPHPENCSRILENLKLNKMSNVELRSIGLGKEKGKALLTFPDHDLARGTAVKEIRSKILAEKGAKTVEIEIDSLDHQIQDLPPPDFIKIDVEGMELDVLLGMQDTIKTYKPRLLIEIHGTGKGEQSKVENAQRVIEFLNQKGYSICHVETGAMIMNFNFRVPREDHFYCT